MPIDLNSIRKKYGISNTPVDQVKSEPVQKTEEPKSSSLNMKDILNKFKDKELNGDTSEKNKHIMNAAFTKLNQDAKEKIKQASQDDPDLKRLADILNSDEDTDTAEYCQLLEKAFHKVYENRLKDYNYTIRLFTKKKDDLKNQIENTQDPKEKEGLMSDYIQALNNLYNTYVRWDIMLNQQLGGDIANLNALKDRVNLDTTSTLSDVSGWELDNYEENLPDLQQLQSLRKQYGHLVNYSHGE